MSDSGDPQQDEARERERWEDFWDDNPHPPIDGEGCIDWCNHCSLCGAGILYGARCNEHLGVYPDRSPQDVSKGTDA